MAGRVAEFRFVGRMTRFSGMNSIFTDVALGAVVFAATNIDDIILLVIFFSQTSRTFRTVHIVTGQTLGFSVLVVISLIGYVGGQTFPRAWVGLLGVVPMALAIQRWRQHRDNPEATKATARSATASIMAVATVTFANGADNLGVYTPLFASSDAQRLTLVLVTFYLLLAVWCYLGALIGRHPPVAPILARYGDFIVPWVFLGLGVYILVEAGTLGWLWSKF